MLVVGAKNNGTEVRVPIGQEIIVELNSNPSTGFSWTWKSKPDPGLLQLEKESEKSREGKPGILGAGGIHSWIFTALAVGSTAIELEYRRPWEEKPPLDRFVLKITII